MLKKNFKLVFRKFINFSVIFNEAKLSLFVYLLFKIILIMSVYPSPNFLNFHLSNLLSVLYIIMRALLSRHVQAFCNVFFCRLNNS